MSMTRADLPRHHERHVRWLMHQYAMTRHGAEVEAARRYWRYPQELSRWDRDDTTTPATLVYFSTRPDGLLSWHDVPVNWASGTGYAIDPFDWDVDELGERVAREFDAARNAARAALWAALS